MVVVAPSPAAANEARVDFRNFCKQEARQFRGHVATGLPEEQRRAFRAVGVEPTCDIDYEQVILHELYHMGLLDMEMLETLKLRGLPKDSTLADAKAYKENTRVKMQMVMKLLVLRHMGVESASQVVTLLGLKDTLLLPRYARERECRCLFGGWHVGPCLDTCGRIDLRAVGGVAMVHVLQYGACAGLGAARRPHRGHEGHGVLFEADAGDSG